MADNKATITRIDETENVAIISFEKAPAHINFIKTLFSSLAENDINVDMISQTAPKGEENALSFTVCDSCVPMVLSIINKIKQGGISPLVSTGNVKISLYGKDMPQLAGVAAGVFSKLCESSIDTLLITTSEVDISIVVCAANADKAYKILSELSR